MTVLWIAVRQSPSLRPVASKATSGRLLSLAWKMLEETRVSVLNSKNPYYHVKYADISGGGAAIGDPFGTWQNLEPFSLTSIRLLPILIAKGVTRIDVIISYIYITHAACIIVCLNPLCFLFFFWVWFFQNASLVSFHVCIHRLVASYLSNQSWNVIKYPYTHKEREKKTSQYLVCLAFPTKDHWIREWCHQELPRLGNAWNIAAFPR